MATIKSYTDLEQSKVLARILPIENADMYYAHGAITPDIMIGSKQDYKCYTMCWSLAALLGVIPQEIFDGEYVINITEGCDNRWVLTYNHCENRRHSHHGLYTGADNLIDACYEMVLKLHELNLL